MSYRMGLKGWILVWCSAMPCIWTMLRTPSSPLRNYFATTLSGFESVLVKEISSLHGVRNIRMSKGGVKFDGEIEAGLAALMWCRTPLKLMERVGSAKEVNSPAALFHFISSIDWKPMVNTRLTLKCDAILGREVSAELSHSHFSSLTVKNAIVDQLRESTGRRPSVNTINPDLSLLLYLHRGVATIYRVWSGERSLHKRGYRPEVTHKAALRETTAAAMLILAGWEERVRQGSPDNPQVLCDPMCGSGTIAIEAALIAADTAPGLIRYQCSADKSKLEQQGCVKDHPHHGSMVTATTSYPCVPNALLWPDTCYEGNAAWEIIHSRATARDLRQKLRDQNLPPCVMANDCHAGSIGLTLQAADRANVAHMIDFSRADIIAYCPLYPPTILVTNPPWDRRLAGAEDSWVKLGNVVRSGFAHTAQTPTMKASEENSTAKDDHIKKNPVSYVLSASDAMFRVKGLETPQNSLRFKAAAVDVCFSCYENKNLQLKLNRT